MDASPQRLTSRLNALSVDFEDWYQGLEIPWTRWAGLEDRILSAGERLLDLLGQSDTKATFFVLGAVAEKHPELIRDIADAGHEVATHGLSHTMVHKLDRKTFEEELAKAIWYVEDATGQKVIGHRAPFFSITTDALWALESLVAQGLRYDSSIFPIRNYRYGIPSAEPWAHVIDTPAGPITEIPLSTVPTRHGNLPVGGGAYFRIYPYRLTRRALTVINRRGHPVVFYLHPWEIDAQHPRIPLPRRIALTHYFRLGVTEHRLRLLLRDFAFAPISEVFGLGT